jgi:inorganic pyrophosphatase
MKNLALYILLLPLGFSCQSLEKNRHLINDISPNLENQWVNMIVEIPTGTNEKWEVNKISGFIERDSINGEPRTIQYLSYPGNYGFIPQTLLSKKEGGDGDPLDILVIGEAVERGSELRCKVLGLLQLMDNDEQDDKLIAVVQNSALSHVDNLEELEIAYPGILLIVEKWFSNYKGPQQMLSKGFKDTQTAVQLIRHSSQSYLKKIGS